MNRQILLWMCLLLFSGAAAIYLSFQVGAAWMLHNRLEGRAIARFDRWEIFESDGKFPIRAYYSFDYKGSMWKGSFILPGPFSLNEEAAIARLKEKFKEPRAVCFNPRNPSESVLESQLPRSLLAKAGVCWGIFFYFYLFFKRFI